MADRKMETFNNLPINQKAKEFLDKIGENTSPDIPYSVQLLLWAIHKGYIFVEEDMLLETVRAMATWSPVRLLNFFIYSEKREEGSTEILPDSEDPIDFARIILDDIEKRIMDYFPWYRSCLET